VVLNPSLLVYSTHPVFTLIVNVKDNGTDSLSASVTITIGEMPAISPDDASLWNSAVKITAYPNPTAGIVRIKIDKRDENPIDIKVVDLFGKTIYNVESNNNEVVEFNLENQLTGIYFALIRFNGQIISRKLIVQR
jgi:hypothetical protein